MGMIRVEAEGIVDAPPQAVYDFMRDYRVKHPSVLPPENFKNYMVELGGTGEGTVFQLDMVAGGRTRHFRMQVSEPEPGRRLVETDTRSTAVTTFTFTPLDGGRRTRLNIATEWQGGGGVGGFFERTFAPRALHGIYQDELRRLASAFAVQPAASR